jgi:hypothetical protein
LVSDDNDAAEELFDEYMPPRVLVEFDEDGAPGGSVRDDKRLDDADATISFGCRPFIAPYGDGAIDMT